MVERNAGLPPDRRIEFRIGVHLGDVVEESDGDLMSDGGLKASSPSATPNLINLSDDAYLRGDWFLKSLITATFTATIE
jgi:adenylate cyclase